MQAKALRDAAVHMQVKNGESIRHIRHELRFSPEGRDYAAGKGKSARLAYAGARQGTDGGGKANSVKPAIEGAKQGANKNAPTRNRVDGKSAMPGDNSKLIDTVKRPHEADEAGRNEIIRLNEAVRLQHKSAGKSQQTQVPSGLQWEDVGDTKPLSGRELDNMDLVLALFDKTEFLKQEWDAFGIKDLRFDDFVKRGAHYFKPVA